MVFIFSSFSKLIVFLSIMLHNLHRKGGDCESNILVSKKDHVSVDINVIKF